MWNSKNNIGENIYYHFLSSNSAFIDLERGAIKVSIIEKLNDPFEVQPWLRFNDPKKRKPYRKVRRELSKKYGLLCFSGKWDEPLMWGHYADKHNGIALGFQLKISSEKILEVEYCSERLKYELTNDTEADEKYYMRLIGKRKDQNWSYENEYRVWVELKKCTKIDGNHFYKFGNELILKEIRLGCRHDKDNFEYVVELAHDYHAKVIPLREEFGGYKMVVDGHKRRTIESIQQHMVFNFITKGHEKTPSN